MVAFRLCRLSLLREIDDSLMTLVNQIKHIESGRRYTLTRSGPMSWEVSPMTYNPYINDLPGYLGLCIP